MRRRTKLLIVLAVFVVTFAGLWLYETSGVTCCAAHAQEEEEGNPGHVEPTQQCSPNGGRNQVACKCSRHRKCESDGTSAEPKQCKSWCFRHFCRCPDPCA